MMQISRELRGKVYGLNAFASRESVTRHFQDSETWRTVKILFFHVSHTKDIFVTPIQMFFVLLQISDDDSFK